MAQLVASIATSGRMPCNARSAGLTKMMSTNTFPNKIMNNFTSKMTRVMGNHSGNVADLRLLRHTSLHVPCRAVRRDIHMREFYIV